jgi:hypothetical protein
MDNFLICSKNEKRDLPCVCDICYRTQHYNDLNAMGIAATPLPTFNYMLDEDNISSRQEINNYLIILHELKKLNKDIKKYRETIK